MYLFLFINESKYILCLIFNIELFLYNAAILIDNVTFNIFYWLNETKHVFLLIFINKINKCNK